MQKLQEQQKKAAPALREKFGYKSVMMVPRIEKVTVNTSFGRLISGKGSDDQRKTAEEIVKDLTIITGQKAQITQAKKSIAAFKTRAGMPVGAKVTLRGTRMFDFLDRLIHIMLPRTRDFRGIKSSSVDKEGNLTLGIREHIFFPEISPEKVRNIFGLEVTITTSAKTREEGLELFSALGFPFTKS
ncbi:MAG: 50S ribosomal protein L5 [Candidatus Yanofskybacteria bacterium]|nr:50S ribosomal protein L5 [Candidatus Yanofskybacteria bacterium]